MCWRARRRISLMSVRNEFLSLPFALVSSFMISSFLSESRTVSLHAIRGAGQQRAKAAAGNPDA
jgi:hypothetical protein